MNTQRIAHRVYEGEISRRVIAGLPEPPPRMVDEIYRWATAKMAAHTAWQTEKNIKESRMWMQLALDKAVKARKEGDIEYAEDREERAQWFKEGIEKEEIRLVRIKQEAKAYPRVSIKNWDRASKKLKVDTRGWKYEGLLRKADPKRIQYAENLWGVITVSLVRGKINSKGGAYWKPATASLVIQTGTDLKTAIRHELIHWSQSYLDIALGTKDFGRPSREIRTPDVSQHAEGVLRDKLKQRGINPDEFHGLDDIEFYTDLIEEVDRFKRISEGTKVRDEAGSKTRLFKIFVGDEEPEFGSHLTTVPSRFFKALKKHARGKWQKAVMELAKAVL